MHRSPIIAWLLRIAAAACIFLALTSLLWPGRWRPIPSGPGRYLVPPYLGAPASGSPVASEPLPQHPFLSPNGTSNMHCDAYASDTYPGAGPLGVRPQILSTAKSLFLGGQCATVNIDRQGRLVSYCSGLGQTALRLLDPHTLTELAHYTVPQRPVNRTLNIRRIVKDTSGGAYFYLDHQDRVVVGLPGNTIQIIGVEDTRSGPVFVHQATFDLSPVLGSADARISAVLPDWSGRFWFVTRQGIVGTVDPDTGHIAHIDLAEEVQNSFAADEEAVFIVSDRALYRFEASPSGQPEPVWREVYDRGTRTKPGMINQGSGTTPALLGERYIAIADNADPQMNVLVYRREREVEGERLICKVPVFAPGRSATENALIGYDRSIIVENNYGYDIFTTMILGRTSEPGLVRIDIDDDQGCHVVWQSTETSQTVVPKVSLGNGILYTYTKDPEAPLWIDAFYLTGIDVETGQTLYKVLTGTGILYDNNYSPITLAPDGTAYVGTSNGLVMIRDTLPGTELTAWRRFSQQHTLALILGAMAVSLGLVLGGERLWPTLRANISSRWRRNDG